MKTFPVIMVLMLAWFRAAAQVDVSLALNQDQFLPNESVPVAVKIINRSGQTLHFGAAANWLTFSVESVDGFVVVKNAEVPVQGEFDLESSQMGTKHVDLQPYFRMVRPGRYKISATLRIPQWSSELSSPATGFDVVNGAKLWEQEFGVPSAPNQPPEMRKYILEQANYLREQLRLYVLVSDAASVNVLKVTPLGPMVSFSDPQAQVDRLGQLHVLWQTGGQTFACSTVDTGGAVVQQEVYDYYDKRPRLTVSEQGDVTVTGGVHRIKSAEVPVVIPPDQIPVPPAATPAKP
jgi:hypothetical protein